ncbi:MAG: TatD family hydrolase [Pseudomonadota bacterium]
MHDNNLTLVDSHAHLDMLKDPEAALERASAAGVVQVVTIGIDLATSQKAAGFAAGHDDVFYTVGLHPHDAAQASEAVWDQMESLARQGAVAWGECGLDFFRDRSPRPLQRQAFARQLELALKLRLPLVIHDRDAHDEVLGMMREQDAGRVGGVVHCFSGDAALAKRFLDLGFAIGIDGPITYPKNATLVEVVRAVPLSSIMLETDCPFLAPQAKRGKPNEPAYLTYTCQGLAGTLSMEPALVAAATTANSRRVFGLPGGT